MLFSSMIFLWVFLAITILGNFLLSILPFKEDHTRIRLKNLFLLIMSLFFYAWGGIYYLLIMIASILINFFGGYFIKKAQTKQAKKWVLIGAVILNLSILFFFKYFNMLVVMIESVMQLGQGFSTAWNTMIGMQGTGALGLAKIVLPIGISFFTFQAMSYVIDVYTERADVQENIIDFALYVSLFPQLIAGPIVRYSDVALQLQSRRESLDLFTYGLKRFCYGVGKKVLLSNTFAKIADDIWAVSGTTEIGAATAWLGIIAYTLQIYYDFSGYSDMAIGLGKMFGFHFKENFNYPYTSLSVQEFWRRWHISLSTWFKEYVYIPLGGNRRGKGRTYLNLFIVFMLTGIWHGANFTFIWWGLMYGILLVIERLFLGKLLQKNPVKIINWLYTMTAVVIGWVYFRSDTIFQANAYIAQMFNFTSAGVSVFSYLSMNAIIMLFVGCLLTGVLQRPLQKYYDRIRHRLPILMVDYAVQFVLLILSILSLIGGTYNPFIYFQF